MRCVGMCAKSHSDSLLLFTIPWTVACQAPLSMEFSKQEHWTGFPCPPPGDLPDPGIEPEALRSLALAASFFTTSISWEAQEYLVATCKRMKLGHCLMLLLFICLVIADSVTPWTEAH